MRNLIAVALMGSFACAPAEGPETAGLNAADSGTLPAPMATVRPAALPQLSLRSFHDAASMLDSIQVLSGGRLLQTLVPPPGDDDAAPAPGEDVDTVDINLDGHVDIQQQTVWGASGNAAFNWWLFDPDSNRFVFSREYGEKIWGFQLDTARREITVHANGGHAGLIFEEYVYQPRGRELVRIRSVEQTSVIGAETYVRTSGRLEGTSWVERSDTLTMEQLTTELDSIEAAGG